MDDTTRQLLHDAAPPVPTGADFDRLWQRATRQRRLQRVGNVAAAVVLVVVAGPVLPLGWGDSLPLLGRGDGDRGEVERLAEHRIAPLSEWDIASGPASHGGPIMSSYNQDYALAVFAIADGGWCVVGSQFDVAGRFDSGAVPAELADRLLCHELRPPRGREPVGTVGAFTIGERVVYWAAVAGTDGMPDVRADHGGGMEPVTRAFSGGGGGMSFTLWSTAPVTDLPDAFEFDAWTAGPPVVVQAPDPVPTEVTD